MGFAEAPATRNALASHGIRISGYRWRWAPGLKGGTYPPHRHVNGQVRTDKGDFRAEPGEDVNGESCMCALVPAYRTADGKLARPGLEPVFQPPAFPVTAAQAFEPFDWQPLVDALSVERPVNVSLSLPDGSVVVNVPMAPVPDVVVNVPEAAPPVVNVEAPNVAAPNVTVEAPNVTVESPTVTVEPRIEVKPAPVKVIREKVNRVVNFRRNASGQIEEATVEE